MAIKALMLAVATVLTVYGIETGLNGNIVPCWGVATVLTVYGIETLFEYILYQKRYLHVATVLTVYGIETVAVVETIKET